MGICVSCRRRDLPALEKRAAGAAGGRVPAKGAAAELLSRRVDPAMANSISNIKMTNPIKAAVSRRRKRYIKDGFNLDLAYITDRLIAMGFPAEKVEGFYRNHIDEVFRFLEEKHKDHYKIYNLCSERCYDSSKFHGRVARYAFEDHTPPNMELIQPFCEDVHKWLSEDPRNVAAVHCKAGKGRTGTMVCCYLLYSGQKATAHEALKFYGTARTHDEKGVTIPSQRRYVEYYASLLGSGLQYAPVKLHIRELVMSPPPALNGGQCTLELTVSQAQPSLKAPSGCHEVRKHDSHIRMVLDQCTPLCGDVRVDVYNKPKMMMRNRLFHFWFNTFFVANGVGSSRVQPPPDSVNLETFKLSLGKWQLDDAHKDKLHKIYSADFKVELVLQRLPATSVFVAAGRASPPSSCASDTTDPDPDPPDEHWDSGEPPPLATTRSPLTGRRADRPTPADNDAPPTGTPQHSNDERQRLDRQYSFDLRAYELTPLAAPSECRQHSQPVGNDERQHLNHSQQIGNERQRPNPSQHLGSDQRQLLNHSQPVANEQRQRPNHSQPVGNDETKRPNHSQPVGNDERRRLNRQYSLDSRQMLTHADESIPLAAPSECRQHSRGHVAKPNAFFSLETGEDGRQYLNWKYNEPREMLTHADELTPLTAPSKCRKNSREHRAKLNTETRDHGKHSHEPLIGEYCDVKCMLGGDPNLIFKSGVEPCKPYTMVSHAYSDSNISDYSTRCDPSSKSGSFLGMSEPNNLCGDSCRHRISDIQEEDLNEHSVAGDYSSYTKQGYMRMDSDYSDKSDGFSPGVQEAHSIGVVSPRCMQVDDYCQMMPRALVTEACPHGCVNEITDINQKDSRPDELCPHGYRIITKFAQYLSNAGPHKCMRLNEIKSDCTERLNIELSPEQFLTDSRYAYDSADVEMAASCNNCIQMDFSTVHKSKSKKHEIENRESKSQNTNPIETMKNAGILSKDGYMLIDRTPRIQKLNRMSDPSHAKRAEVSEKCSRYSEPTGRKCRHGGILTKDGYMLVDASPRQPQAPLELSSLPGVTNTRLNTEARAEDFMEFSATDGYMKPVEMIPHYSDEYAFVCAGISDDKSALCEAKGCEIVEASTKCDPIAEACFSEDSKPAKNKKHSFFKRDDYKNEKGKIPKVSTEHTISDDSKKKYNFFQRREEDGARPKFVFGDMRASWREFSGKFTDSKKKKDRDDS